VSRRQFLRAAAGVTGVALGSGLWLPSPAQAAARADPRPIPGGRISFGRFIHHFAPLRGNEPGHITDFKGLVGRCNISGSGTGIDTDTGEETPLLFGVDLGFQQGLYVGEDGRRHHGTFAFL
jgi:hypothetical protein